MDNSKNFKDSAVVTVFNYFMWFFMANIYFLLSNIPLVVVVMIFNGVWNSDYIILLVLSLLPVGPSSIALLKVMDKLLREKYISVTKDYFVEYYKNFKYSLIHWTITLGCGIILVADIIYFTGTILWSFFIILLLVLLATSIIAYPIIARYKLEFKKVWAIAFIYAIKKFNITLGVFLLLLVSGVILYQIPLIAIYIVFSIVAYMIMKLSNNILEEIRSSIGISNEENIT